MPTTLDYRTREIPPYVLADYAFRHLVAIDEAELRLRASLQMQERAMQLLERHGALPRWSETVDEQVRPALAKILEDVERLAGEHAGLMLPGASDEVRVHASFLALMFFDDDAEPGDLSRIPRSWWSTPLGRLCDRVLHVGD